MRSQLSVRRSHVRQQLTNRRKNLGRVAKSQRAQFKRWLQTAVLPDPLAEKRKQVFAALELTAYEPPQASETEKAKKREKKKAAKNNAQDEEAQRKLNEKKAAEREARRAEAEAKKRAAEEEAHKKWKAEQEKIAKENAKREAEEKKLKEQQKKEKEEQAKKDAAKAKENKKSKGKAAKEPSPPVEEEIVLKKSNYSESAPEPKTPTSTPAEPADPVEPEVVVVNVDNKKKNKKDKKKSESEAAPAPAQAEKSKKKNKKNSESEPVVEAKPVVAEAAAQESRPTADDSMDFLDFVTAKPEKKEEVEEPKVAVVQIPNEHKSNKKNKRKSESEKTPEPAAQVVEAAEQKSSQDANQTGKKNKKNKKASESESSNIVEEVIEKKTIVVEAEQKPKENKNQKNKKKGSGNSESSEIVIPASEAIPEPQYVEIPQNDQSVGKGSPSSDKENSQRPIINGDAHNDNASKKNNKKKNKKNKNSNSISEKETRISDLDQFDEMADNEVEAITGAAGSHSPPIQVHEVSSTDEQGNRVIEKTTTIHVTQEVDGGSESRTQFQQNVEKLVQATLAKHDIVEIDPTVKMRIDAQLIKLSEKKEPAVVREHVNYIKPLPMELHISRPSTPSRERLYKLLPKDILFCAGLIDTHGENYAAMAGDSRNVFKENSRSLQRKIRIFKDSPHFQTYLRAKEENRPLEELISAEAY